MSGWTPTHAQDKLQNIADDEPIFRRNYGVGAAELSELEMHSIESGKRVELTMQLFTPPRYVYVCVCVFARVGGEWSRSLPTRTAVLC